MTRWRSRIWTHPATLCSTRDARRPLQGARVGQRSVKVSDKQKTSARKIHAEHCQWGIKAAQSREEAFIRVWGSYLEGCFELRMETAYMWKTSAKQWDSIGTAVSKLSMSTWYQLSPVSSRNQQLWSLWAHLFLFLLFDSFLELACL